MGSDNHFPDFFKDSINHYHPQQLCSKGDFAPEPKSYSIEVINVQTKMTKRPSAGVLDTLACREISIAFMFRDSPQTFPDAHDHMSREEVHKYNSIGKN